MDADIIAVGPFSKAVADVLDYPAELYSQTRPGCPVVVELFELLISGSRTGSEFAKHIGINDAWDFNQHAITLSKIDYNALERFCRTRGVDSDDCLHQVARLRVLAANGFILHFRPNG